MTREASLHVEERYFAGLYSKDVSVAYVDSYFAVEVFRPRRGDGWELLVLPLVEFEGLSSKLLSASNAQTPDQFV